MWFVRQWSARQSIKNLLLFTQLNDSNLTVVIIAGFEDTMLRTHKKPYVAYDINNLNKTVGDVKSRKSLYSSAKALYNISNSRKLFDDMLRQPKKWTTTCSHWYRRNCYHRYVYTNCILGFLALYVIKIFLIKVLTCSIERIEIWF